MYTVTRQIQWPDGTWIVEISQGGLDYANPDMLVTWYDGEGQTFENPVEALAVARQIRDAWKADASEDIEIGYGATFGMTMPFSGRTDRELQEWAEKRYRQLVENAPSCDWCGEPMLGGNPGYWAAMLPEERFCREFCAESACQASVEAEEENN